MSPPPASPALQYVLRDAPAIAEEVGQPVDTAHHLALLLTFENPAKVLLRRYGVRRVALVKAAAGLGGDAPALLADLRQRCVSLGEKFGSAEADCLHLLHVLVRAPESAACRALVALGTDVPDLRRVVLRHLANGPRPRGLGETVVPEVSGRPRRRVSHVPAAPGRARAATAEAAVPGAATSAAPAADRRGAVVPLRPDAPAPEPAASPGASDGRPARGAGPPAAFAVDPDRLPLLARLGTNLTAAAAMGEVEPVIGREEELTKVVDVLNKRQSNSVCLVGPPGVGKTAIVHGLARSAAGVDPGRPGLDGTILLSVAPGDLLAGTAFRGALSERLRDLREEVLRSDGRIVLFVNEFHELPDGQGGEGAANDLKAALADGRLRLVAATTEEGLRARVESDGNLLRRFVVVHVEEPGPDEALAILQGSKGLYEESHRVVYAEAALEAAVRLSRRYIQDKHLPDKALNILDEAGVVARRKGLPEVGADLVAEVTAAAVRVPVERLLQTDDERLGNMEAELSGRVVGHDGIMGVLAGTVRRNHAGFGSRRPIGSFLFLGPTGVGKTETAKALADFLFDDRKALTQVDMSEFVEPHSVARLVGSPPGYVAHEAGGQLTDAVRRRPYQVVLLDEVEKAHPDVLKVLLQVLEEGHLTDGRGRRVSFTNTVVILTSNLGAARFGDPSASGAWRRPAGFVAGALAGGGAAGDELRPDQGTLDAVLHDARAHFPIELWNRIDAPLVFAPLSKADLGRVARLLIRASSDGLREQSRITYEADDAAISHLIAHGGWSRELGARPMRRAIQTLIEEPLSLRILSGAVAPGAHVRVTARDAALRFDPA